MPKTAGTSFAVALRQHFGDALAEDYDMHPFSRPRVRREWEAVRAGLAARGRLPDHVRAIHGHFLPVKYAIAQRGRDVRFVTWLRDPVERMVSHYQYWKRYSHRASPAQPLRHRVLRQDWSMERFCLGPEMRNFYHQFLWCFAPERFAFIGITEHYQDDLARFAQAFLGADAPVAYGRINPERATDAYPIQASLRARIEQHHAADMALYRWAMSRQQTG